MSMEVMDRRAADNQYLHKDFHAALNRGIEYLHLHFGEDAVREYLRDFAASWYRPLSTAMTRQGLDALRTHLRSIYDLEGAEIVFEQTENNLVVHIPRCPAIAHIRGLGDAPAALFAETTLTVYRVLCEDTPFAFECLDYDAETGRAALHFFRRTS